MTLCIVSHQPDDMDVIVNAFARFCKTKEPTPLTSDQLGYLDHAFAKARQRGGHPMFLLMALAGGNPTPANLIAFKKACRRKAT